jgi:hypothetical protein
MTRERKLLSSQNFSILLSVPVVDILFRICVMLMFMRTSYKIAPQQARWLQDSLLPHQWQQSEKLHLGWPTQAFDCSTNSVAESTGNLLLVRLEGELAVRKRGPAHAMCGFDMRLFANKVLRKENWCQVSGLQSILTRQYNDMLSNKKRPCTIQFPPTALTCSECSATTSFVMLSCLNMQNLGCYAPVCFLKHEESSADIFLQLKSLFLNSKATNESLKSTCRYNLK